MLSHNRTTTEPISHHLPRQNLANKAVGTRDHCMCHAQCRCGQLKAGYVKTAGIATYFAARAKSIEAIKLTTTTAMAIAG